MFVQTRPQFGISLILLVAAGLSGACAGKTQQTRPISPSESRQDVEEALTSIAGAMQGKDLSDEEARRLKKQIMTDPEAQSAIRSISEGAEPGQSGVKYSPATGKRYAPHLTHDPETGVPLKWVGEE